MATIRDLVKKFQQFIDFTQPQVKATRQIFSNPAIANKIAPPIASQNEFGIQRYGGPLGNLRTNLDILTQPNTPEDIRSKFVVGMQMPDNNANQPLARQATQFLGNFTGGVTGGIREYQAGQNQLNTAQGNWQQLQGLGKMVRGAGQAAAFMSPIGLKANILSTYLPSNVLGAQQLKEFTSGMVETFGRDENLAQGTEYTKLFGGIKLPQPLQKILGTNRLDIEPYKIAGNMYGFVNLPQNKMLFQLTNMLMPTGGTTLKALWSKKGLPITLLRGGIEDLILDFPDMPDNLNPLQKAQWVMFTFAKGAGTELGGQTIGRGSNEFLNFLSNPKIGAQVFDELKELMRRAKAPVQTNQIDARTGQRVIEPNWLNTLKKNLGGKKIRIKADEAVEGTKDYKVTDIPEEDARIWGLPRKVISAGADWMAVNSKGKAETTGLRHLEGWSIWANRKAASTFWQKMKDQGIDHVIFSPNMSEEGLNTNPIFWKFAANTLNKAYPELKISENAKPNEIISAIKKSTQIEDAKIHKEALRLEGKTNPETQKVWTKKEISDWITGQRKDRIKNVIDYKIAASESEGFRDQGSVKYIARIDRIVKDDSHGAYPYRAYMTDVRELPQPVSLKIIGQEQGNPYIDIRTRSNNLTLSVEGSLARGISQAKPLEDLRVARHVGITPATLKSEFPEMAAKTQKYKDLMGLGKYQEAQTIADEITSAGKAQLEQRFAGTGIQLDIRKSHASYFDEPEPTLIVRAIMPKTLEGKFIQEISAQAKEWGQDTVHISELLRRPERTAIFGKPFGDGFVYQPDSEFRFERELTPSEIQGVISLVRSKKLAGATVHHDKKGLSLYNVGRDYEGFIKHIAEVTQALKSTDLRGVEGSSGKPLGAIRRIDTARRLLVLGDPNGGATRGYEQARSYVSPAERPAFRVPGFGERPGEMGQGTGAYFNNPQYLTETGDTSFRFLPGLRQDGGSRIAGDTSAYQGTQGTLGFGEGQLRGTGKVKQPSLDLRHVTRYNYELKKEFESTGGFDPRARLQSQFDLFENLTGRKIPEAVKQVTLRSFDAYPEYIQSRFHGIRISDSNSAGALGINRSGDWQFEINPRIFKKSMFQTGGIVAHEVKGHLTYAYLQPQLRASINEMTQRIITKNPKLLDELFRSEAKGATPELVKRSYYQNHLKHVYRLLESEVGMMNARKTFEDLGLTTKEGEMVLSENINENILNIFTLKQKILDYAIAHGSGEPPATSFLRKNSEKFANETFARAVERAYTKKSSAEFAEVRDLIDSLIAENKAKIASLTANQEGVEGGSYFKTLQDQKKTIRTKAEQVKQDAGAIFAGARTRERGFTARIKAESKLPVRIKKTLGEEYVVRPTKVVEAEAFRAIQSDTKLAEQRALNPQNDTDVEIGNQLLEKYSKAGNAEKVRELAHGMAQSGTTMGQAIHAFANYDMTTPAGAMKFAQTQIKKYNDAHPNKPLKMNDAQVKDIFATAHKIRNMADGEAKNVAAQQLIEKINNYIPSSIVDKGITVWKAGLLTSLRTHERNLIGNTIMNWSEVAKDPFAVLADTMMALRTGKRSMSFTTRGMGEFGSARSRAQVATIIKSGIDPQRAIEKFDVRHVTWNTNNPVERVLKVATDAVFRTLGAEDKPFFNAAFARSLYDQAGTRAINEGRRGDIKFIENLVKNPTTDMKTVATADANYSTFHDKNMLTELASNLKKVTSKWAWSRITSEVFAPFTGVPSSILEKTHAYSPLGLLKGSIDFGKVTLGNVPSLQRQAAQEIGRGVLGTGLWGLGAFLMQQGLMTGQPRDGEEADLWEAQGKQKNSIWFNGKWRDINSIGPQTLVLLAGAKYAEIMGRPDGGLMQYGGLLAKDQISQSMLQGIYAPLQAIMEPKRAERYLTQQASSIVPNFVKDIAKANDTSLRETYVPKNTPESIKRSVMYGIPGLRNMLPEKRDVLGNVIKQEPTGAAAFVDLFNSQAPVKNAVVDELARLYQIQSDYVPSKLKNEQTINKRKRILTPEELNKLEAAINVRLMPSLNSLIASEQYQRLDDEDKAAAIKNRVDTIRKAVRENIDLGKPIAGYVSSKDAPKNIIEKVGTYGQAVFTEPAPALKAILAGNPIRKVDNGMVILERQEGLAGDRDPATERDHIVPLSLGGTNEESNLQYLTVEQHKVKTKFNNYLLKQVREGSMTKAEARKRATNWRNEVGTLPVAEQRKLVADIPEQTRLYSIEDNETGKIKDIDIDSPIKAPTYSGFYEVDKKLKSKYKSAISRRISDIIEVMESGQITAAEAERRIQQLRATGGGTGKKGKKVAFRAVPKAKLIKISLPKSTKAPAFKMPKLASPKKTKSTAIKISKIKPITFKKIKGLTTSRALV